MRSKMKCNFSFLCYLEVVTWHNYCCPAKGMKPVLPHSLPRGLPKMTGNFKMENMTYFVFVFHVEVFAPLILFFLKILLKLLGWHWLMKLQFSSVQLPNTSSVYYIIVCSPPLVRSASLTTYHPFTLFYLPPPLSLW